MGSTRFPGKVLRELSGAPMLHHVITRASRARTLDEVVIATSRAAPDDAIEGFCARARIRCVRGSEDDVLDRYHAAADVVECDVVVRLTADCPLIDPEVIDQVVRAFQDGEFDYVSNIMPPTFPDGLDTEVFSRSALERAWREARLASDREHVTPYIRSHPEIFRQGNVAAAEDHSEQRWTVDEPRDLELVRAIYAHFDHAEFGWREVLGLVQDRPELLVLNAGIARNEGYEQSLRQDRMIRDPESE